MPSTRALIHAPWSASKVSTALRCPRLFHFKYVQKLKEPEVMPEARIGKAIHHALELSLQGTALPEALTTSREKLQSDSEHARFDALATGIPAFTNRIGQFKRRRRVQRQLVEYSLAVREDLTSTQFYAGDAYFRGVLDLGYLFSDDGIALVDHKTGVRLPGTSITDQLEGYAVLAAAAFRHVRSFWLGVHWIAERAVEWSKPVPPAMIADRADARPARQHRGRRARGQRWPAHEPGRLVRSLQLPRLVPGEPRGPLRARRIRRGRRGLMTAPADRDRVRVQLLERLRRFEWEVAREDHARAVHDLVRGSSHELLNFVQIVDLASQALAPHCAAAGEEFLVDLARAAADAKAAVRQLHALARVDRVPGHTAAAACAGAAIELVGGAVDDLDAKVRIADDVVVAWAREELELLLIALALDGRPERGGRVELLVRTRDIDGRTRLEIVCGPIDATGVGVRLAAILAMRIGGDAVVGERRGGGDELAVDVPIVRM